MEKLETSKSLEESFTDRILENNDNLYDKENYSKKHSGDFDFTEKSEETYVQPAYHLDLVYLVIDFLEKPYELSIEGNREERERQTKGKNHLH